MKLQFYGAAREVTGSCHCLRVSGKNILIDCGLRQGKDEFIEQGLPFAAGHIDFVLLTHAHIDHAGRLPLLAKEGFKGQVFATEATTHLSAIMLRDSAHIQAFEAEWRERKALRSGKKVLPPLYTMEDADAIIASFVPCAYEEIVEVFPGLRIRFRDIGHLLGSACIEVWASEFGQEKKIVFSGDIGNINQPLIKNPGFVESADYVIMESTYGDRLHNPPPDYAASLAAVIQRTFDRGGNVVIPSFAVGRTQELLYFIRKIKTENLVSGHEGFRVYMDSPLANEATQIFGEERYECFDEEAMELVNAGINPIAFDGLVTAASVAESIAINTEPNPCIIISSSGMCEAGRIKHHLKHNLWRKECSIVFCGYQAVGTTGRALADGAKHVKILGEDIEVKAEITALPGVSGHADQKGLLHWLFAFEEKPSQVFVVHGEDSVAEGFAKLVTERFGIAAVAPQHGAAFDLITGTVIEEGKPMPKKPYGRFDTEESSAYAALLDAYHKLDAVVRHNKTKSNKEIEQFTRQIKELCEMYK